MNYYYSVDGSAVLGPEMLDKLRELQRCGSLPETTKVCRAGDEYWQPLSSILTEPLSSPQQGQSWYYSQSGKRLGPLNEAQIGNLIAERTLCPDSLVWCEGMADWTPAHLTALKPHFGTVATPPPLTGENVNNGLVWTLAFVPILASLLEAFFAAASSHPQSDFWWVALPLNIGLCLADEKKLKNAGHNTNGMTAWALLLVPVYLFVRASRLKQNNGYAIVWLVTFFLSLYIK